MYKEQIKQALINAGAEIVGVDINKLATTIIDMADHMCGAFGSVGEPSGYREMLTRLCCYGIHDQLKDHTYLYFRQRKPEEFTLIEDEMESSQPKERKHQMNYDRPIFKIAASTEHSGWFDIRPVEGEGSSKDDLPVASCPRIIVAGEVVKSLEVTERQATLNKLGY